MKELILKYKNKALYMVSLILFAVMSYMGVKFCNAGHYYEQGVPFRIFCICLALLVLIRLPLKDTLTVWSVIWLPICYVITHIGYERHLIPDNCDYQFVDLIRLGKLVILSWGLMLIALLKNLVREDLPRRFFDRLRRDDKFRRILTAGWCLYALLLTLINPGYSYVIVFTIGFPAFLISNRDRECRKQVYGAYLDGILLCFLVLSVRSMLHRPYDTERYLFYFSNENMAGMYLSVVAMTMAVRLENAWNMIKGRKRTVLLILLHLLTVWTGILVMFNYTRTYLLGMGFSFFVYFIVKLRQCKKKGVFVLRFLLPFVLILACMYPGYLVLRYLPAYSADPVYFTGEWGNETRVQPGDPVDSPHYTSIQRYLRLSLGKLGIDIEVDDGEEREAQDSFITIHEGRDVSNGRMTVWKHFLARVSLRPHYPGDITVDDDWNIYHAHNTYLQNAYQFGIPAGVFFGLLILGTYIFSVVCVVKKRTDSFAMLSMGCIMVAMLTEWSGHPVYPNGIFLLIALYRLVFADCAEEKICDKAESGEHNAQ